MGAAAQGAAIVSVNGDVVCRCEWGTEVAAMAYDLTGDGKGLLRGVHALAGVYVFLRKLYGVCAAGSCMRSFAARGIRPFSLAIDALVVRFGL